MKYRLTSDDDGHKYIIPVDKEKEWYEYLEKVYAHYNCAVCDYDAAPLPKEPEWVVEVNGPVSFDNYEVG